MIPKRKVDSRPIHILHLSNQQPTGNGQVFLGKLWLSEVSQHEKTVVKTDRLFSHPAFSYGFACSVFASFRAASDVLRVGIGIKA